MKIAVIFFNLGGPDKLESVKPFLFNLFNDKAIIGAPQPIRYFLAKFISSKREKYAQKIYEQIGGKSPIVEETTKQSEKLELLLNKDSENEFKVFMAMRYWKPRAHEVVAEVKKWGAEKILLLPLYPQFSTTTTDSSLNEWIEESEKQGITAEHVKYCCYPTQKTFIDSHVNIARPFIEKARQKNNKIRVLFSAHGLPQKVIDAGDPYQWQVEQTVKEVSAKLGLLKDETVICYQSRVGPLKWIGPATEDEIERAGKDNASIVLIPIAFVSEHSETLVELDIQYKELALEKDVPEYYRVPTLSSDKLYIESLHEICLEMIKIKNGYANIKICPEEFCKCRNIKEI